MRHVPWGFLERATLGGLISRAHADLRASCSNALVRLKSLVKYSYMYEAYIYEACHTRISRASDSRRADFRSSCKCKGASRECISPTRVAREILLYVWGLCICGMWGFLERATLGGLISRVHANVRAPRSNALNDCVARGILINIWVVYIWGMSHEDSLNQRL